MTTDMTITTPIQMRFFDMDSFGHVSNGAQQMYFDRGKTDLFRELWNRTEILAQVPAVTVSVNTDFFSQIRFGDEICVVTEVEKIGHKSFTLLQRIMRSGQECSRSRTVMVVFDKEHQQSVEVPEAGRRILCPTEK